MSSAAAKAEARRKAILSRGTDRLAKLTSSARGEGAPAYMHDDKPPAMSSKIPRVEEFVGEESTLPTPPAGTRASRTSGSTPADMFTQPDANSDAFPRDMQEQFFAAMMNAAGMSAPGMDAGGAEQQQRMLESMLGGMTSPDALLAPRGLESAGDPTMQKSKTTPAPPQTRSRGMQLLLKIWPFAHLAILWILLAFFIILREPEAYNAGMTNIERSESRWQRWAELARRKPSEVWDVQSVPFFWTFVAVVAVLHWTLVWGVERVQLPMWMMAIPPQYQSWIKSGMQYMKIGRLFFDDIAVIVFGVGMLVWFASWFAK